jgi:cysteine desulfurase
MPFFKHFFGSRRIYLDYASSTPLDASMLGKFPKIPTRALSANPSALHKEGVELKGYFTSGATESDNLAISGAVNHLLSNQIQPHEIVIFASDIEHAAVSETITHLTTLGVRDGGIPTIEGVVESKSIIIPEGARVLIVSVMYVNNEIGTVQPIADIAKRLRYIRKQYPELTVIFHVDATQAPLHYSLNVAKLGVDMMTLGATKLYCPKGVGVLYKKRAVSLKPIMYGGGQEFGLRPGTEAVEIIHMFSHALEHAANIRETETARIYELREYFETKIQETGVHISATHSERAPHISHIAVPNFDSELLVLELDVKGIAVSAKSACKNEDTAESMIVEKLHGKGYGAVRFSFGRMTTKGDVDRAIRAFGNVLKKYS